MRYVIVIYCRIFLRDVLFVRLISSCVPKAVATCHTSDWPYCCRHRFGLGGLDRATILSLCVTYTHTHTHTLSLSLSLSLSHTHTHTHARTHAHTRVQEIMRYSTMLHLSALGYIYILYEYYTGTIYSPVSTGFRKCGQDQPPSVAGLRYPSLHMEARRISRQSAIATTSSFNIHVSLLPWIIFGCEPHGAMKHEN